MLMIERGYDRRYSHTWSATRWETFYLMSAFAGSDAMKKNGINDPTDLLHLPWEISSTTLPTIEEQEDLKDLMNNVKMPIRK